MEKKFELSEYNQRIRLYLNKQMNSTELESFENEIRANQDLANEVKAQQFQRAFNYLKLKAEINEVRASLENIPVPVKGEEKKSFFFLIWNSRNFKSAFAASLLIIIGLGLWFGVKQYQDEQGRIARAKARLDSLQRIQEKQSGQIVYASETKELINSNIADSKQPLANIPAELKNLALQYEQAEDRIAYKKLARQLVPRSVNPPAQNPDPDEYGGVNTENNPNSSEENTETASYRALYHGLSLLALDKYDAALRRFEHVKVQQLADEVQWYKTLTYLKKGDTAKGRESLESIVNSNSKFKTQAQQLIDSINKNSTK